MKPRYIALLYSLLLFLASCAVSGNSGRRIQPSFQATKWILVSAEGITIREGQRSYLYLNRDSTIHALAQCNTLSGRYQADTAGSLQFRNLNITWKACPDPAAEARYLDLLKAVTRYEYTGKELRLFRGDRLMAVFNTDGKSR